MIRPNSCCIRKEVFKEVLAPLIDLHIVKVLLVEVFIISVLRSDLLPRNGVVHLDFLRVDFCLEFKIAKQMIKVKRLKNISLDQKVHIPVFLPDREVDEGGLLEGGFDNPNWEDLPESGDVKQLDLLLVCEL